MERIKGKSHSVQGIVRAPRKLGPTNRENSEARKGNAGNDAVCRAAQSEAESAAAALYVKARSMLAEIVLQELNDITLLRQRGALEWPEIRRLVELTKIIKQLFAPDRRLIKREEDWEEPEDPQGTTEDLERIAAALG